MIETRICDECKRPFEATHCRMLICSPKCRKARHKRQTDAYHASYPKGWYVLGAFLPGESLPFAVTVTRGKTPPSAKGVVSKVLLEGLVKEQVPLVESVLNAIFPAGKLTPNQERDQ